MFKISATTVGLYFKCNNRLQIVKMSCEYVMGHSKQAKFFSFY